MNTFSVLIYERERSANNHILDIILTRKNNANPLHDTHPPHDENPQTSIRHGRSSQPSSSFTVNFCASLYSSLCESLYFDMTHHYLRTQVGALCAGLIIGACVNMFFLFLNTHSFFPLPDGVTMDDTAAFAEYIRTLPAAGYILVFTAHFGQVLVGGRVAAYLCPHAAAPLVYWITALTGLGSIANTYMLRHDLPLWTWWELPLYPVVGGYWGPYCAAKVTPPTKKTKPHAP